MRPSLLGRVVFMLGLVGDCRRLVDSLVNRHFYDAGDAAGSGCRDTQDTVSGRSAFATLERVPARTPPHSHCSHSSETRHYTTSTAACCPVGSVHFLSSSMQRRRCAQVRGNFNWMGNTRRVLRRAVDGARRPFGGP